VKTPLVPLSTIVHPAQGVTVTVASNGIYPNIGLLNRGRGVFVKPPVRGFETKYTRMTEVRPGQLIYSKLFGWEGSVALVPEDVHGHYVSGEFPTFDLNPLVVDEGYLAQVIRSDGFVGQMGQSTTGMGQRRQRVNVADFLRIKIPLPSLDRQRRVAAHLERVAVLQPIAERANTLAISLVQAAWYSLRQDLASARQIRLDEVLQPVQSDVVQADRVYPVAGVFSFGRGLLQREAIRGVDTKYKTMTRLSVGNLVYSKLGAFEGAVSLVSAQFAGSYVSPEFPVFEVAGNVHYRYLHHLVSSASFADQLNAITTGVGARQKRVSPTNFLSLRVPVPDCPEQRRIAAKLDGLSVIAERAKRAAAVASAIVPAARNEVFSSL
jgi:type I restriction enzyme S subunit